MRIYPFVVFQYVTKFWIVSFWDVTLLQGFEMIDWSKKYVFIKEQNYNHAVIDSMAIALLYCIV